MLSLAGTEHWLVLPSMFLHTEMKVAIKEGPWYIILVEMLLVADQFIKKISTTTSQTKALRPRMQLTN
jgi:hypothetical protein